MIDQKTAEPKTAIKKANTYLKNPIIPNLPTVRIIKRSIHKIIMTNTEDTANCCHKEETPIYRSAKQRPIAPQITERIIMAEI